MSAYVIRRLAYSVIVVIGAMSLIFVTVRVLPGDPAANLLPVSATREEVQRLRDELGLDDPLVVQYGRYITNAVRFDFGESPWLGGEAVDHVLERLPKTAALALSAIALSILVSFPLGVMAARRPNSILDRFVTIGSLAGQALPQFWVGLILILVFARQFELLPSAGSGTWKHFILPTITLALPFISLLTRLVRGGLLEVMNAPYIDSARAKGMRERRVVYRHGVRNMLIPVVTVLGLQLGSLIGGTVIVEIVFSWPGIGRLLIRGIGNRDFVIVQASVALITVGYVLVNLIVDVLYTYLDPRVRLESV